MCKNHIGFSWAWTVTVIVHFLAIYLGCQLATITVWFIDDDLSFRHEMRTTLQEMLDKSTFEFSLDRRMAELAAEVKSIQGCALRLKCDEKAHHTPFQDSCYFLSPNSKNWTDAQYDCLQRKGNLIKVSNDEEFDFLKDVSYDKDVWVGLKKDGETWKWVADGTIHDVDASRAWWGTGLPNNNKGNEDCVLIDDHPPVYPLNDELCTYRCQYICEIPLKFLVN